MADLSELVTIEEAAEHTGYRPDALRKAVARGRLYGRRMGSGQGGRGLIVTTLEDVARYVAQVEDWRNSGRQPHARRKLPRSERVTVEEVMPE